MLPIPPPSATAKPSPVAAAVAVLPVTLLPVTEVSETGFSKVASEEMPAPRASTLPALAVLALTELPRTVLPVTVSVPPSSLNTPPPMTAMSLSPLAVALTWLPVTSTLSSARVPWL